MPFTFSHPAIVLPFENSKRRWFSLTGLIVGSIVPDMEFLMQLKETHVFGHTWLGFITFDIPAAFLLGFIFHNLVRDPLIINAPKFFRERFSGLLSFNWVKYFKKHAFIYFVSILIGIASHIFLDAFTHESSIITSRSSFFSKEIIIGKNAFPVFLVLQVLTSLTGGLYILWFIFKMKRGEAIAAGKNTAAYWISLGLLSIVIFVVRIIVDTLHQSFDDIFIAAIGSCLYALVLVSLIYYKKIPHSNVRDFV